MTASSSSSSSACAAASEAVRAARGAGSGRGKASLGNSVMERARRVVELPSDAAMHVLVVRLEHALPTGQRVREIVLSGGMPHQQGLPGPVRRLSSPYRGVSFHSCTQRWRGRIKHGTKSEHLGYYTSDLEAAKVYNVAASKIHGAGAQLNEGVDGVGAGSPFETRLLDTTRVDYDETARRSSTSSTGTSSSSSTGSTGSRALASGSDNGVESPARRATAAPAFSLLAAQQQLYRAQQPQPPQPPQPPHHAAYFQANMLGMDGAVPGAVWIKREADPRAAATLPQPPLALQPPLPPPWSSLYATHSLGAWQPPNDVFAPPPAAASGFDFAAVAAAAADLAAETETDLACLQFWLDGAAAVDSDAAPGPKPTRIKREPEQVLAPDAPVAAKRVRC